MAERYVVSDERLAEIRAMVRVDDIDVVPVASADDLASAVYDLLVDRDEASEDIARLRRVESAAVELVREPFGRLALRSFYALREALGTEPCEVCGLRYEMGQHYGLARPPEVAARHEYRVPAPLAKGV